MSLEWFIEHGEGEIEKARSSYLTKEQSDAVPDFPYLRARPLPTSRLRLWKKDVRKGAEAEGVLLTVEWLEDLLRHEDWFVRLAAARGLAATGDVRAAQVLISLVRGDTSRVVREAAAEELTVLSWQPGSPFEEVWRSIASRKGPMSLSDLLLTSGREAWLGPLADALMSADVDGRIMAAHALGKIGDESPPKALLSWLEGKPGIGTKEEVAALERIAARAGNVFGSAGLISILSAQGSRTDHRCISVANTVRGAAALELGKLGDRRALATLIEMLRDPERKVRQHAATALGMMNWQPANVADQAWFGIVAHAESRSFWRGGSHMVAPLLNFLQHPDAYMGQGEIAEVARALGYIGEPRAVTPLLELLRATPDRESYLVREVEEALEALKSVAPIQLKAKLALVATTRWASRKWRGL